MVQREELALKLADGQLLDSISPADTVEVGAAPVYGIVLTPPSPPEAAPLREREGNGVSFILSAIFLLFLVVALRFRNNVKYAVTMFRNLIETRTRQNVFDDTVRETSLMVLLNILWCACAGIIIYTLYLSSHPGFGLFSEQVKGILGGIILAGAYSMFMWGAYSGVGWLFSDRSHSELWVKGYSASQALMTPAFFLTALIAICHPEAASLVGLVSAIIFIAVKLIFIWKGFKIFFSQISSWVLFLCYLCSLEIVPLIIVYRIARFLVAPS